MSCSACHSSEGGEASITNDIKKSMKDEIELFSKFNEMCFDLIHLSTTNYIQPTP